MKKLLATLSIIGSVCVIAQTMQSPVPVDFKSRLLWDDPNPAGSIQSWKVIVTRSAQTAAKDLDVAAVLNGFPAGDYSLCVAGYTNGVEVSMSTNIFVTWPGGSGKKKPVNLRISTP